jgi:hypothetical protein
MTVRRSTSAPGIARMQTILRGSWLLNSKVPPGADYSARYCTSAIPETDLSVGNLVELKRTTVGRLRC